MYAQKWIVTAFKVAKPDTKEKAAAAKAASATTVTGGSTNDNRAKSSTPNVATSAVRMTFKADRPFYPYREPEDQRKSDTSNAPRLLRVYFIGNERMEGTVGDAGEWKATVRWSKTLDDANRSTLIRQLKFTNESTPEKWWLTEFEDRSSPRPGVDEVYFKTAKDQQTVERTAMTLPSKPTPPTWPMFAVIGIAFVLVYARRALRRASPQYGVA